MAQPMREMGGSLQDFIDRVNQAFYKAFPNQDGAPYRFVMDVFEDHVIMRESETYYRVGMTVTKEAITFAPETEWAEVKPDYVDVSEMSAPGVLLVTVSEFSGDGWKDIAERIPVPASLLENDPDPFFVTMPVCFIGAESRGANKLVYGERANQQIVEQINAKKPEGIWGHMDDSELDTRYDRPSVMAVGAVLDEGTSWAKFYVPPYAQDTRDYYKARMALNAQAGFSLFGTAQADASSREVESINLQKVDIADPERVGLPVAAVPIITRHMAGKASPRKDNLLMAELTQAQVSEMQGQLTALQGRVAEMAQIMGVAPDRAVETLRQVTQRATLVSEMASGLGVKEDELVAKVAEMRTAIKAYHEADLRAKVRAEIGAALADLEPVIVAHMGPVDGWPQDDAGLKTAVKAALEKPEVKRIAEMVIKAKGGPALALGTAGQQPAFDADKVGYEEAHKTGMLHS